MLKVSGASADKRMYKFAKRRVSYYIFNYYFYFNYFYHDLILSTLKQLGTHSRALKKREQVKDLYAKLRAKAAMQH